MYRGFRLRNAVLTDGTPEANSLLDWQLYTLGQPLADLGYTCANYDADYLATEQCVEIDFEALGIPREQEFLDA